MRRLGCYGLDPHLSDQRLAATRVTHFCQHHILDRTARAMAIADESEHGILSQARMAPTFRRHGGQSNRRARDGKAAIAA